MVLTKRHVLKRLGVNQSKMAGMFGLTRAAVTKWPNSKPIPYSRWIELKYKIRPDLFADDPDPLDKKAKAA